ncbi:MAG: DDE-type integrase/transposase/recombinase [Betaproteobacteria bacterium]|nr:DDE-type integrase/transposase/recombinase [Candidatus Dechloromonas phosphorivorans]
MSVMEKVPRGIRYGLRKTNIVMDALTMAWFRKRLAPGLMHHSDRGSQYASRAFQDKLKAFGMTCSISRKGNCWETRRRRVGSTASKPSGCMGFAMPLMPT